MRKLFGSHSVQHCPVLADCCECPHPEHPPNNEREGREGNESVVATEIFVSIIDTFAAHFKLLLCCTA